jgi:hypothetical protein
MKKLRLAPVLPFLMAWIAAACSGEPGAADASAAAPAPAATQDAGVPVPRDEVRVAAPRPSTAGDSRAAGQRYESGLQELDSTPDLSTLAFDPAGAHTEDDGHDHGAEPAPADPNAPVGRIALAEGSAQVKDFGRMRQGEVGTHAFEFVSSGEGPLVITGVKPSCGCTKAEVSLLAADGTRQLYTKGNPIPVGERFLLETEINTDGRQGHFNSQVTMFGNDLRGNYTVRMTADIEPILAVTPSNSLYFGRITTAERAEKSVGVRTTRGEPFLLSLAQEAVQEGMQIEIVANEPDAEGRSADWRVHVALGPVARPGMNNFPLSLKTDMEIKNPKYVAPDGHPQYHMVQLQVQAQVVGMVSAEPAFMTFGMVRPGEPVERSLRLECHDDFKLTAGIPVALETLQGQPFPQADAFEVSVTPLEEGHAADLKVRLKGLPEDMNGSLTGVLRVKVGHPHMEALEIRFSAVCRPGLPPITAPAAAPSGQKE